MGIWLHYGPAIKSRYYGMDREERAMVREILEYIWTNEGLSNALKPRRQAVPQDSQTLFNAIREIEEDKKRHQVLRGEDNGR